MTEHTAAQPADEFTAAFVLIGDFVPDEISAKFGFLPNQLSSIEDTDPGTGLRRLRVFWSRGSRLDRSLPVERHVLDVLEQIAPSAEAIVEERTRYAGRIQIISTYLYPPGSCCLPSAVLGRIAALGLDLVFDSYNLIRSGDN